MKRIAELSPIIAALLIFNGYLKLYLFYGHWDIKIIDYLVFTEIILSFLNDINIIVLCLVIFLFHQVISYQVLEYTDNRLRIQKIDTNIDSDHRHNKIPTHGPLVEALVFVFTKKIWTILLILFVVTAIFLGLFFITYHRFWLYLSMALLFTLLVIFFDTTVLEEKKISETVAAILTFFSFTICLASYDIKIAYNNAALKTKIIYTDSTTITTSETILFIGKTQNYIFIYDSQLKCTNIIPVNRLLEIEEQIL